MKILIAEDEKHINDLIMKNLTLVGHECVQVFDGAAAEEAVQTERPDLLILDVMMPKLSGFEVIERVKSTGVPVIFVTAKGALSDKLAGLRLGADDYIVKPFAILELVERVNAVLRRTKKGRSPVIEFDDIRVDPDARRVTKGGEPVELSPKEYDLLEMLILNRNLAISREQLLFSVWGPGFDVESERTVDTHVSRLRHKLGLEKRLVTVFKTGYRLEV